jgi:undecaprenyl diphosphate synthase
MTNEQPVLLSDIPKDAVPEHIAIIMDGNGRWAKSRGLPRLAGHRAGTENLRNILEGCGELGIKYLTLYAFSTENWGRPQKEVMGIIALLESVIDTELDELHERGVQLNHLGHIERLKPKLQKKVREAIELTKNNDKLILNIAFNYGGRDEIVHAIQQMIEDGIAPDTISEQMVSQYLFTKRIPDPDLVIRTSGEVRISNFLIWQAAYAEWYFTPVYWPDFGKQELYRAVLDFSHRERRYGLTTEQNVTHA